MTRQIEAYVVRTKINQLLLVYATSHQEAVEIAKSAGYKATSSWLEKSTKLAAPASFSRVERQQFQAVLDGMLH